MKRRSEKSHDKSLYPRRRKRIELTFDSEDDKQRVLRGQPEKPPLRKVKFNRMQQPFRAAKLSGRNHDSRRHLIPHKFRASLCPSRRVEVQFLRVGLAADKARRSSHEPAALCSRFLLRRQLSFGSGDVDRKSFRTDVEVKRLFTRQYPSRGTTRATHLISPRTLDESRRLRERTIPVAHCQAVCR